MSGIELQSVSVALGGVPIVEGVSLAVEEGEWLTLIGPNGAGKSTLLRAIAQLAPCDGSIRLDGVDMRSLRRRELSRRIAFVPQSPLLPPAMSIRDYVLLGRTPYIGTFATERRSDHEAADRALRRLELVELASRPLRTLSGGEQQRAVLARALAQEAPLLLLDEPTAALDLGRQQQVLELVAELRLHGRLTVVSAMHELTLAAQYCDRLALISSGRLVAAGAPREIATRELIAEHYNARVEVIGEGSEPIAVIPVPAARLMPALMVQGVSSWAGKSLVTTALVRLLARRGVRVAPFKGQNMSNNARVVAGGEIGVAQYLQALAAGIEPDTRMNPVLVKPEGERQSQVVIDGRPDAALSALPWRARGPALWEPIERALRSLLDEYELVVIEGAGSPAEINLRSTDLANMRVAHAAEAPVLLVADIDRGGAFAHLYGTWALLDQDDRATIRAFVLNKFRGDASLLPPAPAELERLTGVPVAGVLPWFEHGLPDEDGAAQRSGTGRRVAVIRYPTASNLDELRAAEQVADIRFVSSPDELEGAALIVLPGSKHVPGDLEWLRRKGLAEAIEAEAAAGTRVLGICGGLQMLGEQLDDDPGLGLLPVRTRYAEEKLTRTVRVRFDELDAPWQELSGIELDAYEIRHGDSDGLVFVRGNVLGVSFHGLLESGAVCRALLGAAPAEPLERVFDHLADLVEEHLDLDLVA